MDKLTASKRLNYVFSLYPKRNRYVFLWNWVVTLESFYRVFAVFDWVFVKFILGNTILSLYFLYIVQQFNWVSIKKNCYPFIEKQLGIQEKILDKYPEKQLTGI